MISPISCMCQLAGYKSLNSASVFPVAVSIRVLLPLCVLLLSPPLFLQLGRQAHGRPAWRASRSASCPSLRWPLFL